MFLLLLFVLFWQVYYKQDGDAHYHIHRAGNVRSYQTGTLAGGKKYMIKVREKRMAAILHDLFALLFCCTAK